jgi:hypothetical protein
MIAEVPGLGAAISWPRCAFQYHGTQSVTITQMTSAQIRAARGLLNWSVRELGKRAGVHWNTVSAIERGKSVGRAESLKAIQKALEKAGVEFTNGNRPGVRLVG